MSTIPNGTYDEYHALLARQDAMRLRRRLLTPAVAGPGPGTGPKAAGRALDVSSPDGSSYGGSSDQETIRRLLPLVTPFDELIDHLYRAMFEQHPYLRGLFPESMDFQRAHLGQAFGYLIEHLDRPEEVTAFCSRLGRDHRKLGVRPVHFEVFEAALAEALRRSAGERWVEALERAWLRMLRFAVAAMVDGANGSLTEPAYWNATVTDHQVRGPDVAVLRVRTAEPFPYRAGQFARVQSPLLPGAWRPYTVACAPRPDGELEFHVRMTGPGGVSEALVAHTRVGDVLRLGPAQGSTTLDEARDRDLLIVAGGTGWATAKALIDGLAQSRAPRPTTHLFLGARTTADLYDTATLAALEHRHHPWLRVVPVIGAGRGASEEGSVDAAVARYGDWSRHLAYVSGPPGMVAAVVRRLTKANLPPDRVRYDPGHGLR
ncbi:globin domain-containing protein [Streptomyces sp. NPDC013740]|uniref:globin domain-containing protein n=1 Tax=Streptomyces sp. NPDC013740 TaxID=3364867 RepID=UPI0036FA3FA3